MEFALGIVAALIGASGAFTGAWLSGRHERELEQERWFRSRQDAAEDARAAAVCELTKDLAAAVQGITWFTASAEMREHLFTEQTIIDYDTEMRARLAATIEGLVAVAHQDAEAYGKLAELTANVWELDWRVAQSASTYWSNPEKARNDIRSVTSEATALQNSLPRRIVGVLQRADPEPHAATAERKPQDPASAR